MYFHFDTKEPSTTRAIFDEWKERYPFYWKETFPVDKEALKEQLKRIIDNNNTFSSPDYEIVNTDRQSDIYIDLPGIKKEDISIDVEELMLSVSANRKTFQRGEIKFNRQFTLAKNADIDNIKTLFVDGVLKITITLLQPQKKTSKQTIKIE